MVRSPIQLAALRKTSPKAFRTSINSVRPMVDLRTEIAGVRLRNPTMLASGFLDETGGGKAHLFGPVARPGATKRVGAHARGGYPHPPTIEHDPRPMEPGRPPDPGHG